MGVVYCQAMSKRARRGLGFVVLALVALLVWVVAIQSDVTVVAALASLTFIGAGVYGLGTLAWGLIRD